MFWRNGKLRLATTVVLLLAISGSGVAATTMSAGRCSDAESAAPVSTCGATNKCCCGDAPVRVCGCSSRDEPAESPLPLVPEDNHRVLKWTAGQFALAFEVSPTPGHETYSSMDRLDFSPVERSVQSRLCVWRC
jgi:hypothetical protein